MISEVTPRGREFLFFSLFSIIGKTSSFIGPLVSSAIIDDSGGNNSTPFYFLTALSAASFVILVWFVDLRESRREQEIFLIEEVAKTKLSGSSGLEQADVEDVIETVPASGISSGIVSPAEKV
jgi:MFS family permease